MEKYQELKKNKKGKKIKKPIGKIEKPINEPIDGVKIEETDKEEPEVYTPETVPNNPPPGTIVIDNVIQL